MSRRYVCCHRKCSHRRLIGAVLLHCTCTHTYAVWQQVLTIADEENHIDKHKFTVPFVCGCRNLGEALRRINEGAAMIRTKVLDLLALFFFSSCMLLLFTVASMGQGEAGTGNVVEAVRHARALTGEIRRLCSLQDDEVYTFAKHIDAPYHLVRLYFVISTIDGTPVR